MSASKKDSGTKAVLLAVMAAVVVAVYAPAARAQAWPAKPVRWVVPFAAGGVGDIFARAIAPRLAEAWGQPVIVDNRPGANSIIGADVVAKSAPDGYTILMAIDSTLAMNQFLYAKLPFDPLRDFAPIGLIGWGPVVLEVDAARGPKTLRELVEQARANPGKLNFGAGTITTQLAGELFKKSAGADMTYIPYTGSAPVTLGLLAGDVQATFNGVTPGLPHVRSGRLRALAALSAQRIAAHPEVPTLAELGFAGFDVSVWMGLVAPAGTPPEVIARIHETLGRVLAAKDLQERMAGAGIVVGGSSPAEFGGFIRREAAKWGPLIRDLGLKID